MHQRVLGAAVLLSLVACKEKPADVATTPPPPAAPNLITVTARDMAFDAADTIPAGMTTIRLINDGPGLHHAQLLRIDTTISSADAMTALKQSPHFPAWLTPVGGPNAVGPGDTTSVTQDLAPGSYLWTCLVDLPGGVPHYKEGMMHALTVAPSAANAAAPTPDVTISLRNYAFALSTPLTAGHHVIQIVTSDSSNQSHELEMVQLAPGKTAQDLLQYLQKPDGPPPGRAIGGVADLKAGVPVYFTANLTPGNYLLICFVPDRGDGKPHFMHGMMETVSVS
jgi:uncharacterized cupredoxin-like copper-binding protein